MLDHIGFSVSNVDASRAFYEQALKPLGIKVVMEVTPEMTGAEDSHFGFGTDRPFFWIGSYKKPSPGVHVAFTAQSRKIVDEFYAAVMAAGVRTMAHRACGRTIMKIITGLLCLIPMATISRPSAILRNENG